MATTLTATPDIGTASVLLAVSMPITDLPQTKYELTLSNYMADRVNWTNATTYFYNGVLAFGFATTTLGVNLFRTVTGLTVGRSYKLNVAFEFTPEGTQVGFVGGPVITLSNTAKQRSVTFVATATSHQILIKPMVTGESSMAFTPFFTLFNLSLLPVAYSGESFALTRTDVNGVNPVRLLPGQRVMDGGLVIEDFEAAITGDLTYSFTAPNGARVSTSTTLVGAKPALAPAVFPQFGLADVFVTGYDASRGTGAVVHEVIGRSDPVVRLQPMKTRRGTLTVWANDYAALGRVVDVYRRGEVVLFRQETHAGMDLYHIATEVREGAYDEQFKRWRLDVTYIEVPAPLGPVLGSLGWTWDSLAGAFPTWDAAIAYFATWNALQIGVTS